MASHLLYSPKLGVRLTICGAEDDNHGVYIHDWINNTAKVECSDCREEARSRITPGEKITDIHELYRAVHRILPGAQIDRDNDGQFIVYTDKIALTSEDNPSIAAGDTLIVDYQLSED